MLACQQLVSADMCTRLNLLPAGLEMRLRGLVSLGFVVFENLLPAMCAQAFTPGGTVSQYVVSNASCPVLVYPAKARHLLVLS